MKNKIKYTLYLLVFIFLLFGYPVLYYISAETIEITVNDRERITTGSGDNLDSKFLIYCEGEVLENTDNLWYLKFKSSDLQNKLKIGETYKVKVAGWRIPFFSWYRNVIEIES